MLLDFPTVKLLDYEEREDELAADANPFVIVIMAIADFDVSQLRQTLIDMRKFTGRRLADYCEQKTPAILNSAVNL